MRQITSLLGEGQMMCGSSGNTGVHYRQRYHIYQEKERKKKEKSRIMANFPHYLSRAMAGKLRMVTEQKTLCRNLAILQNSIV